MPLARHLLRARDLADARYSDPLSVADLAAVAGLSPAHFSRQFKQTFGESPHQYLLTRRLERAAALLRTTDWSVADDLLRRRLPQRRLVHHQLPSDVRPDPARLPGHRTRPPNRHVRIPRCVAQAYGRPQNRTFREDGGTAALRFVVDSGSTGRTDDQDRQRAVLGARSGRGARLLYPDARLGGAGRCDHGGVELPLALRRTARPGRRGAGADAGPRSADARRGRQRPARRTGGQGRGRHAVPRDRRLPGSYDELSARGVVFNDPPTAQPYGIDTSFRDPSGNNIRLTQVLEFDPSRH